MIPHLLQHIKRTFFVCFLLLGVKAYAITFITLSDNGFVGDHNQALGVRHAFKGLYTTQQPPITYADIDAAKPLATLQAETQSEDQKIIVVAGKEGIKGLQGVQTRGGDIVCLTSHVFLEEYKEWVDRVTFIALPTHVVTDEIAQLLGEKLIKTVGVAHNRQTENVDDVYRKHHSAFPETDNLLAVMLGGDVPAPEEELKIKRFTENDATTLADFILQQHRDKHILVLNGPRTGKHDQAGVEDKTVHRGGKADDVTHFFQSKLQSENVPVTVFDFQYNTEENKAHALPFNSFAGALGLLRAKGGQLLVPGESTSMISESVDMLGPDKIVVYTHGAMNESHDAHVQSEFKAGRIQLLGADGSVTRHASEAAAPVQGAAQVIATRLYERIVLFIHMVQ